MKSGHFNPGNTEAARDALGCGEEPRFLQLKLSSDA